MQQRASAAAPSLTPRLTDGGGNNSNFPSDILEDARKGIMKILGGIGDTAAGSPGKEKV